jgi:hypothetical protein
MLRRPAQVVQAEVKGVTPPDVLDTNWPTAVDVTLRLGEREIPIRVPTVMGDGTTPDVWYPYWQVAGKPTDRNRCFVGPDGEHWVHVCDLRPGDAVAFTPSTFDFEYLEEVNDIERAWREISRRSTSQIRMVEALIETKRSAWEQPAGTLDVFPTFKQFVVDVLREAEVYSPALEQAALTSLLADALEIHLTIHKEKPQQEEA